MLENKWTQWTRENMDFGKVGIPKFLDDYSGVYPSKAVLDPKIGAEMLLCIIDRTEFSKELAALSPFHLNLKMGLVRCGGGPVCFALYWLKNPNNEDEPFAMFEHTLNPHDPEILSPYWQLANQTHWHVFVIGPNNEMLKFYEFSNVYGVGENLKLVGEAIQNHPCTDFDAAKAEFQQKYTMMDLYHLGE